MLNRRKIATFGLVLTAVVSMSVAGCGGSKDVGEAGSGSSGGGSAPDPSYIKIGTASQTGVYYPVGGGIAKRVNEGSAAHGVQASVEATDGSVFNVNALMTGDLDFGIVQSDRQYQAWNGEAEWESAGPQKKLRAVCMLYTEMVTLAAATDVGITSVADLAGKTVNIGNPGSGTRVNAEDVLAAAGLDPASDLETMDITAGESPKLFQDERVDAFFFTVGHPAGTFMELVSGRRPVGFVPIEGEAVGKLIEVKPYYESAKIPVDNYAGIGNASDVSTIGLRTSLVTSAEVDEDTVYEVTKAVFDNLDDFPGSSPGAYLPEGGRNGAGQFRAVAPGCGALLRGSGPALAGKRSRNEQGTTEATGRCIARVGSKSAYDGRGLARRL